VVDAVAEVLPLDSKIGRKGPVAPLAVTDVPHGLSKCEINIALKNGV